MFPDLIVGDNLRVSAQDPQTVPRILGGFFGPEGTRVTAGSDVVRRRETDVGDRLRAHQHSKFLALDELSRLCLPHADTAHVMAGGQLSPPIARCELMNEDALRAAIFGTTSGSRSRGPGVDLLSNGITNPKETT